MMLQKVFIFTRKEQHVKNKLQKKREEYHMRLIRHSAGEQHYYVYLLLVFSLYTTRYTTVAVFANLLPL